MPVKKKSLTPSVWMEADPEFAQEFVQKRTKAEAAPALCGRFTVPPFTILSVNKEYWKEQNRFWIQIVGLPAVAVWGHNEDFPPLDMELDQLPEGKPLPRSVLGSILDLCKAIRKGIYKPFSVVPTTIWSARQGYWQKVKRRWIYDIGLRGERGRSEISTANNICSDEWGRGVKTDGNPDRVLGIGLSEGQDRINKVLNKYAAQKHPDAVPGGGAPRSVRRRAAKDLGNCFGSGRPGDLALSFKEEITAESPKLPGDFIGAKVRDLIITGARKVHARHCFPRMKSDRPEHSSGKRLYSGSATQRRIV